MTAAARYQVVTHAGSGAPWLVMVHGATQHSRLFSGQVGAFSSGYRLFLVDLPGHGRSSDLTGPFGQVEYAASVRAALMEAGIERFHYWGTHTGAAVGLLLALEEPDCVLSLILEGAVVPGASMPYTTRRIEQARATARSRGAAIAIEEWYDTAEWFDVMRRDPLACRAADQKAMLAEFGARPWLDETVPAPAPTVEARLGQLQARALLVNGERDLPEFLATADHLEQRLPDVTRVTIPDAEGFPLWERPEAVNHIVLGFLSQK